MLLLKLRRSVDNHENILQLYGITMVETGMQQSVVHTNHPYIFLMLFSLFNRRNERIFSSFRIFGWWYTRQLFK